MHMDVLLQMYYRRQSEGSFFRQQQYIYDKIMSGSYFCVTTLEIQHIYFSVKEIENLTVYIFYKITRMQ